MMSKEMPENLKSIMSQIQADQQSRPHVGRPTPRVKGKPIVPPLPQKQIGAKKFFRRGGCR